MRLPDFRESCNRVRKSHLSPFCLIPLHFKFKFQVRRHSTTQHVVCLSESRGGSNFLTNDETLRSKL